MVKVVELIRSTDKKAEDEFDEKWCLSSATIGTHSLKLLAHYQDTDFRYLGILEYSADGYPQPKRPGFREIIVDIPDPSDTEGTEHTGDTEDAEDAEDAEDTMPRKSNVSQASAAGPSTSAAGEEAGAVDANGNGKEKEGISVEVSYRFLYLLR